MTHVFCFLILIIVLTTFLDNELSDEIQGIN